MKDQITSERAVTFTQFLLPDGRQKTVTILRPERIARMADAIYEHGYRLEAEVLTTGEVSFTVTNDIEGDIAFQICDNGPDVPKAVDILVRNFYMQRCQSELDPEGKEAP